MDFDLSDVAGITAALGAGYITERKAKELLLDLGFEDDMLTSLVSIGIGAATGAAVGSVVESFFDDFF